MRTTLTLDEDVAEKLRTEVRKSGRSFKETVNHFLRLGLTAPIPRKRQRLVVRDVGFRLGTEFTSTSELIERLEGREHR